MLNEDTLRTAGLDEFEIVHAMANIDTDYGDEHVVRTDSGRQVRCPAFPADCDYARVTTVVEGRVVEIAYWNTDEFREAPSDVLGALLGALGGRTETAAAPPPEADMSDVYRTTIQVTVLHTDETGGARPLSHIAGEIDEGDMLGHSKIVSTRQIPKADLKAEQVAVGGDGSFFPAEEAEEPIAGDETKPDAEG